MEALATAQQAPASWKEPSPEGRAGKGLVLKPPQGQAHVFVLDQLHSLPREEAPGPEAPVSPAEARPGAILVVKVLFSVLIKKGSGAARAAL